MSNLTSFVPSATMKSATCKEHDCLHDGLQKEAYDDCMMAAGKTLPIKFSPVSKLGSCRCKLHRVYSSANSEVADWWRRDNWRRLAERNKL